MVSRLVDVDPRMCCERRRRYSRLGYPDASLQEAENASSDRARSTCVGDQLHGACIGIQRGPIGLENEHAARWNGVGECGISRSTDLIHNQWRATVAKEGEPSSLRGV